MTKGKTKPAVLFDFFGTLVDYQPERDQLGYPKTFDLAASLGYSGTVEDFVVEWDASSRLLEAESKRSLYEFTMTDAATAFAEASHLLLTTGQCVELGQLFVNEWQRHVQPIDGVGDMLRRLSRQWQLAVVSNTHDHEMVPRMLTSMGVNDVLTTVVLSVSHRRCKPHPSIYRDTLATLAVSTDQAVFVGDNHEADFVGPEALGIRSYLIDPDNRHNVVRDRRLDSVLDLESRIELGGSDPTQVVGVAQ